MRCRQADRKFEVSLGKVSKTLSRKQNTNKKAVGMVQVVEHLPSKQQTLGSDSSMARKKKESQVNTT
jgi:prolyl-tRNA editing enzyme YbaK/EbsC (Cys-tRNA(Pro) deacylase)